MWNHHVQLQHKQDWKALEACRKCAGVYQTCVAQNEQRAPTMELRISQQGAAALGRRGGVQKTSGAAESKGWGVQEGLGLHQCTQERWEDLKLLVTTWWRMSTATEPRLFVFNASFRKCGDVKDVLEKFWRTSRLTVRKFCFAPLTDWSSVLVRLPSITWFSGRRQGNPVLFFRPNISHLSADLEPGLMRAAKLQLLGGLGHVAAESYSPTERRGLSLA